MLNLKSARLLIALLVTTGFMAGTVVSQDGDQDSVAKQRIVEQMLKQLEDKMLDLADKLKDKSPEEAQRLREALHILTSEQHVRDRVRDVIAKLEDKHGFMALDQAEIIETVLKNVLSMLEEKADIKELLRQRELLKKALKTVRELKEKEIKLREETRKLREEVAHEVGEKLKELEQLHARQAELKNKTESGPPKALLDQIDEKIAEIDKLIDDQNKAAETAAKTGSPETRSLSEFIQKIDELIEDQSGLRKDLNKFSERTNDLDSAIQDLKEALKDQKSLRDRVADDPENTPENRSQFFDAQKSIGDRVWNAGNKLYHSPNLPNEDVKKVLRESLAKATDASDSANSYIRDGDWELAKEQQDEAIKALESTLKALTGMKDTMESSRAGDRSKLAKEQSGLQGESGKTSKAMSRAANQHRSSDPATTKAMENAAAAVSKASGSMGKASGQIGKKNYSKAGDHQKASEQALRDAKKQLERAQEAVGAKDKDAFAPLAKKQDDMSDRAEQVGHDLRNMAENPKASDPQAAQDAMQQARESMADAASQMGEASQAFGKPSSASGQSSQGQAKQSLQKAKQALQQARKQLADRKQPDMDATAKAQQKLKDELEEKITKWLEKKKKELEKKAPETAKKMGEAQADTQNAQQNMSKAKKQMPNGTMAGKKMGEAMKDMKKAMEKLKKMTKAPLNKEQKKKAEELAEEQKKIKELTDELRKQLDAIPSAGQKSKSASKRASENMGAAKHQIQKEKFEEAEEEEEEAIEDLGEAEEDLKDKIDELTRMAEEEFLIALETELKAMIEEQMKINLETKEIDQKVREEGAMTYVLQGDARALSQREKTMHSTLEQIHAKLEEEDATVFAYAVRTIQDDLEAVAQALHDGEVSRGTQRVEEDILRQLKDLARAFNESAEDRNRTRPRGGGGGGGGKPPLVPDVAQLRLIRTMQKEVLRRTKMYRTKIEDKEKLTELDSTLLRRMTERETRVKSLLKMFAEKFMELKEDYEKGPDY